MGRSCASMRPRHSCAHAHQMDIQVQCAAEALNQGNGPCVSNCFCITGFSGQVRSNGAADIIQRLAHDFRLAGKQESERKRYTDMKDDNFRQGRPRRLLRRSVVFWRALRKRVDCLLKFRSLIRRPIINLANPCSFQFLRRWRNYCFLSYPLTNRYPRQLLLRRLKRLLLVLYLLHSCSHAVMLHLRNTETLAWVEQK
jgi:hypothetical protein